jgi:hypothetical protein
LMVVFCAPFSSRVRVAWLIPRLRAKGPVGPVAAQGQHVSGQGTRQINGLNVSMKKFTCA